MPIFTAIAAAAFGAGTFLAGASAFLLRVAAGIGLSFLAQALAGKKEDTPAGGGYGVQGTLQADGDVPRSIMLGYGVTAGSLIYANTWGQSGRTPNSYLTQVIALSDLPIQSLEQFWVNGELCALRTDEPDFKGYPVIGYRQQEKDYLWVKFYDGTQTTADTFLTGTVSSAGRSWDTNRVGYGVAYVIVTARANSKLFTGFPTFKFAVNGVPLYDPSKDSSVGGTGTQRWNDDSTWGGDGDFLPAVQIYNLLRGIRYEGDWLYGAQAITEAQLPASDWIAAIETNRTEVDIGGSDTEPRFRSGGQVTVANDVAGTIEALLSTCHGRLAEIGGVYKLVCGDPGSSIYSISDSVILSSEEQSFSPFFGLSDTVNGITAKYPEPDDGWNATVAPPRYDPDFEEEDGNRRLLSDVSLDYAPYKRQVQRLMKMALQEARRARRHTIVLPPEAWPLEPQDVIEWTSDRNGYNAKLFRVDGVMDRANLDVVVDITEINPNDYDFDPDVDFTEPTIGSPGRVVPIGQPIIDWAATGVSIQDADGKNRRPAISLSWDSDVDDVIGVQFEVRLAETQVVVYRNRTDNLEAGGVIITQGLLPNEDYEVRGRYIPDGGNRDTTWSEWIAVSTPDTRLGIKDFTDEIQEALKASRDESLSQITQVKNTLGAILTSLAATDELNKESINRSIQKRSGELLASFTEQIDVAVGDNSAIAQLVDELSASVNELNANVLARYVAGVTPAGALSLIELSTIAESASAGFKIVAFDDGAGGAFGQVWIDADKLLVGKSGVAGYVPIFTVDAAKQKIFFDGSIIATGSIKAASLAVGALSAISADLGKVTAGSVEFENAVAKMTMTSSPIEFAIYQKT